MSTPRPRVGVPDVALSVLVRRSFRVSRAGLPGGCFRAQVTDQRTCRLLLPLAELPHPRYAKGIAMGDRTPIQVHVYSCPPELVDVVLDTLERYGLGPGDSSPSALTGSRLGELELGVCYSRVEISVGSSEDVAGELPGEAAWKVWEDPAYEHLGQVHLHHPDLGRFSADCDACGRAVFTNLEVDRLAAEHGGDLVQLRHNTGLTWEQALEALASANAGIVLPRDAAPGSAPLQAVALNQLASGPSRWLPERAPRTPNPIAARER